MAAVAAASPPPNGRVAQGYLRTGHFSTPCTASKIGFCNSHVHKFEQDSNKAEFEFDAQKISWSDSLKQGVLKHIRLHYHPECITTAMYRPFCKQMFFNYKPILERTYQIPRLFPTPQSRNLVICVSGVEVTKEFSCIIVDTIPDL